jgi:NADH:ubiquinone oxidoreductase subunit C
VLGVGLKQIRIVLGLEIEISVASKNVYGVLLFLNKHTLYLFKSLTDIVCYDTISKTHRFFFAYVLLTPAFNLRMRLLTKINEFSAIFSCISLFKSAC